jgi:gamma-glutamylcyclotransferase (GGCT)/AIG2-like uncharacterized protein YtfP
MKLEQHPFLFAYGLIAPRGKLHRLVQPCRFIGRGTITGLTLSNVGKCPVAIGPNEGMLHGMVFRLTSVETTLNALGWAFNDDMCMVEQEVELLDGTELLAWTYMLG